MARIARTLLNLVARPARHSLPAICLAGVACTSAVEDGYESEPTLTRQQMSLSAASEAADDDQWAGIVAISLPTGGVCTGTLVHPQLVLSAAHCIEGASYSWASASKHFRIYGGADLARSETRERYPDVERIAVHPEWDQQLDSVDDADLALLKLSSPVHAVRVYALRPDLHLEPGQSGVVLGYGQGLGDTAESEGLRRIGVASVLALEGSCFEFGDPTTACPGDSGGPFLTLDQGEWVLRGVISFVEGEARCDSDTSWGVDLSMHSAWLGDQQRALLREDPDAAAWDCAMSPGTQDRPSGAVVFYLTALISLLAGSGLRRRGGRAGRHLPKSA